MYDVATDDKISLGRYKYSSTSDGSQYWITCQDQEIKANQLVHGPFSQAEANSFINMRIARADEMK